MGQKVHPTGIRLGIVKKHASTWYSGKKDYADKLYQDLTVREYIQESLVYYTWARSVNSDTSTVRWTLDINSAY